MEKREAGKLSKSVLSILLALTLLFGALSSLPIVSSAAEYTSWEQLAKDVANKVSDTYTLTRDIKATGNSEPIRVKTGDNVTLDLNGHTLSRNFTTVQDSGHVLVVQKNAVLTVIDSSETNAGKITGGYSSSGGGIYVSGTLNLEGGTVTGNHSTQNGAGIYIKGGTVNISGGVISGNKSDKNGGGIFVCEDATLNTTGGVISSNSASTGAGIFINKVSVSIKNTEFTGNKATEDGGAVFTINDLLKPDAMLTMENCIVKENSAKNGGGLAIYNSARVKNCKIENNSASNDGGGARVEIADNVSQLETVRFDSTDFLSNTATNGGGLYANGEGQVVLHECRVNQNHAENNAGGIMSSNKSKLALIGATIDQNSAKNYCGGFLAADTIVSMKGLVMIDNNGTYGKYKVFKDMMLDGDSYIDNPGLYEGSYIHLSKKYIAGETVYAKDISRYQTKYFHIDTTSANFKATKTVKTPLVASLFGGNAGWLAIIVAAVLVAIGAVTLIIRKKNKKGGTENENENNDE